jgi:DNA-binding response OmpR family regulator
VLIVEDDPDQAVSLTRVLEIAGGFRVSVAGSLAAAADAARRDPPGAAVIDIGLPGEDGVTVARVLLAISPERPLLIALTGTHGLADRLFQAGFDKYFLKPPDPDALITTLELHRMAVANRR